MRLRIGYARKSAEANLKLQKTMLFKAKCDRIFCDLNGDSDATWPQLMTCLAGLRRKDTLVVYCLDRIGKNLEDFLVTQSSLTRRGIGFESIVEGIETSSPAGRMVARTLQSLYAFSDNGQVEPAICARRARLTMAGQPKKTSKRVSYDGRLEQIRTLMNSSDLSIADLSEMFNLSKSSVYKIWTDRQARDSE